MKLNGTPLASDEFKNKYKYVIKHRIVPRQFSLIDNNKIFDTEEVIVGTKDMSFEDYLELRELSFTISSFFNSTELVPLKRFLIENSIELSEWVFNLSNELKNCKEIYSEYLNFIKETKEELFDSRKSLIEFFNDKDNFQDLMDGIRGDNLLRKYKCNIISKYYDKFLEVAFTEAFKLLPHEILIDIKKYVETANIKSLIDGKIENNMIVELNYDVPSWLDNKGLKKGKFVYRLKYPKEKIKHFKNMFKDPTLSLQIIYRGSRIIHLFPKWIKVE
ncbi:hypothetical protein KY317_04135, partial [Candidatus Woesearchaeota archaeon]|nr:hypothetical protein [Candidatus Woesearchaeota archaeon]